MNASLKKNATENTMQTAFVARQPIFDRDLNVYAYELLFRNSDNESAQFEHPDTATLELINNSLSEIGLKNLIEDKLAFINVTKNVLLGPELPLPHERVVLELLEDINYDDILLERIKQMKTARFQFALDDFIFEEQHARVFEWVSYVKLDIKGMSQSEIESEVNRFKKFSHIRLLAEKVETMEEFDFCQSLGFDYFQGFFLSRPKVISGKKLSTSQLSIIRLLGKIHDSKVKIDELDQLISSDVTLSYRLLKMINSSFYGVSNKVNSVNHALVMLGLENIRKWVSLVSLSCSNEGPGYLMHQALVRAKMAEKLASANKTLDANASFTCGLFSVLPSIMQISMEEILEHIPLSDDILKALLNNEGKLGKILECVKAHEKADWEQIEKLDYSCSELNQAYAEALEYSQSILSEIH